MNKIWAYTQYGYLVVGIIFSAEGILKWNSDKQQASIMFGLTVFIIIIFFFKRNFRKRTEQRNTQRK